MALKVDCAWARVFIRETKNLCSIEKIPGEGSAKFGSRVLQERFKIYSEHFKEYPQFHMSQHDFYRVCKTIDEKIGNWRNKVHKEAFLKQFSSNNWNEGKEITKGEKKEHSLSSCRACFLFNSQLQSTFPLSKNCRGAKNGPLCELQVNAKRHIGQKDPKVTNKKLKTVGEAIYATYNSKCKENFGKSLSDILLLVPEAGLQKKLSPTEKKKNKRDQQRKLKTDVENKMSQTDVDSHLSLCESYSSRKVQRLAQSFETYEEALERTKKTPPKVKDRLHTPLVQNIEGDTEQLLEDVKSWPDEKINWSEKARTYKIRTKGQEATPANGGQMIKEFLISKGVAIGRFQPSAERDCDQGGCTKGRICNGY